MSENNKEQILEIEASQLEDFAEESVDKLPPIEIPMEWYDEDEFHRGIHDSSYLSGVITALLNTGVTEDFVINYLLNDETIKHNIEVAKINKETNIEVAKQQKVTQEKYEL